MGYLWTIIATLISGVSVYLAVTQTSQLKNLKKILANTQTTAEKLQTDQTIRESVAKLFGVRALKTKKYHCFFPAEFRQKPTPLINAGDYRALQVLNARLTPKLMVLHALTGPNHPPVGDFAGNLIYLCAPTANRELQRRFPVVDLQDDLAQSINDSETLAKLPCWFSRDHRLSERKTVDKRNAPINGIVIKETRNVLSSESEWAYIDAASVPPGEVFESFYVPGTTLKDKGIFARITDGADTVFILAGIHQAGTWIVAEFLDSLLAGGGNQYRRSRFLGDKDFIAIIEGEFSCDRLSVLRSQVDVGGFWKRPPNGDWYAVEDYESVQ